MCVLEGLGLRKGQTLITCGAGAAFSNDETHIAGVAVAASAG